jgi:hypothetical protein
MRRFSTLRKVTPSPLAGGGWGEGATHNSGRSTPPPNPLPQGEGEFLRSIDA